MWLKKHYLNSSSTLKQQRSSNHPLTGHSLQHDSPATSSLHHPVSWFQRTYTDLTSLSIHPPSQAPPIPLVYLRVPSSAVVSFYTIGSQKENDTQGNNSVAQSCLTLWDPMSAEPQASLSITNSQSLLKLMSIESVMSSNRLILCRPLLLLPSIFPSIRVFSNESVLCIRWPKYWSFSFSISPSNEYSGLISFRMG